MLFRSKNYSQGKLHEQLSSRRYDNSWFFWKIIICLLLILALILRREEASKEENRKGERATVSEVSKKHKMITCCVVGAFSLLYLVGGDSSWLYVRLDQEFGMWFFNINENQSILVILNLEEKRGGVRRKYHIIL